MKKQAGVYKIENLANGKCYYGSSIDLKERFRKHKESLLRGKHHNKYLQNSFNKHKLKKFKFTILDIIPEGFEKSLEQWYLDNVVNWGHDYNLSKQVQGCRLSEKPVYHFNQKGELIKKYANAKIAAKILTLSAQTIRSCARGVVLTYQDYFWTYKAEENLTVRINRVNNNFRRKKEVHQYDIKGQYVKTFSTISKVISEGFLPSGVSLCCHNKQDTSGGYIWVFKKEEVKNKLKSINNRTHYRSRKVYQFSKEGVFIKEFKSIKQASLKLKINSSCISAAALGTIFSAYGFRWSYLKNKLPDVILKSKRKSILQLDLKGKVLNEFSHAGEAAAIFNVSTTAIFNACTGKTKSSQGYKWKYKND